MVFMTTHRKTVDGERKEFDYPGRSTVTIEGPIEDIVYIKSTAKNAKLPFRRFFVMMSDVWNSYTRFEKKNTKYEYKKAHDKGEFKEPPELKKPFRVVAYGEDVASFGNPFELVFWVLEEMKEFLGRKEGKGPKTMFKGEGWLHEVRKIYTNIHLKEESQ